VTVYNLKVDEFHTYYAGIVSVLVHNADYQGQNYDDQEPLSDWPENGDTGSTRDTDGGTENGLKFGDKDLILGLNKNGSLADFKAYGGKGYGEFSTNSRNFSSQIKDAMDQSEKIRFNLDGVDTKRISGQLNDYGEPMNGYTNYELWLIKNNPDYLNKTVFYQNGQVVPFPFK
jgi:hypothetical protein